MKVKDTGVEKTDMKVKSQHNMIKSRLLIFLLTLTMCAWLWPWNLMEAQAATATELKNPQVTVNSSGDVEKATWDCIWFGNYKQSSDGNGGFKREPIKWRVLSVEGKDAFLIADQNLDCRKYNETDKSITWETCTLRSWLNGYDGTKNTDGKNYSSDNFINEAFSFEEQQAIRATTVVNEDNPSYGTEGGNDATDQIYLLSIEEAENTAYGFSSNYGTYDAGRRAKNTGYAKGQGAVTDSSESYKGNCWWWLRSPGDSSSNAAYVYNTGFVRHIGKDVGGPCRAVRPTLHLNLESNLWSYAGTVSSDGIADEVKPTLQSPQTASDGTATWDCVWFGNYKQSSDGNGGFKRDPIKWRVLSVNGNDAFLLADQNLDCKKYSEQKAVTWETCTLRNWLNSDFIKEAFSPDEQQAIQTTNVANKDNPSYGTSGGNDTTDQIYLLSIGEAKKEAHGFSSSDDDDTGRYAKNTDYAQAHEALTSGDPKCEDNGRWWLRSPGEDSNRIACVDINGSVSDSGYLVYSNDCAVRPALHLNLQSDLWSHAGTVSSDGSKDEKSPTYKISYDANGGTGAPVAQTKTYDEILPLSSTIPTRAGYDFLGWSEDKAAGTAIYVAGSGYTKNANAILYAVWKERPKENESENQNQGSNISSGTSKEEEKQNNTQQDGQTANGQKLTQTISASSKTLTYKGNSVSLNAKTNGDGKLVYKNSNKKVVTVSASGTLKPKECGSAKIWIQATETGRYKVAIKAITVKVLPKKPSLRLKRIGKSRLKLSWSKVPGASGYKVYTYNAKKKKYVCTITKKGKQRSAIHGNPKKGKTYQYKVRAYRKVGKKVVYGPYSKVAKARG